MVSLARRVPVPLCSSPVVSHSHHVSLPLCPCPVVSLSRCVPLPLCLPDIVSQSRYVLVPLCHSPLCPDPTMSRSLHVPVPLCPSLLLSQSRLCPSPGLGPALLLRPQTRLLTYWSLTSASSCSRWQQLLQEQRGLRRAVHSDIITTSVDSLADVTVCVVDSFQDYDT